MVKKKLLISGKVQGVSFRYHAHDIATKLQLVGWVKNLNDGRVEIVIGGSEQNVDAMIKWCYKGPPLAQVENIELSEYTVELSDEPFSIRRDGGKP
jgi:acylphosphatase